MAMIHDNQLCKQQYWFVIWNLKACAHVRVPQIIQTIDY